MKFFLDENISIKVAQALRDAGYDAVAAIDAGLSGATDAGIRQFCTQSGSILVTLDADFGNILRFSPAGTKGVIWVRSIVSSNLALMTLLSRSLPMLAGKDLQDSLIVIDDDKIRIRRVVGLA